MKMFHKYATVGKPFAYADWSNQKKTGMKTLLLIICICLLTGCIASVGYDPYSDYRWYPAYYPTYPYIYHPYNYFYYPYYRSYGRYGK